jgi:hypothetical protein
VVSLYAPTVPAVRWRPWQVPHALLHIDVPVSPADVARAVARLVDPVALEAAA